MEIVVNTADGSAGQSWMLTAIAADEAAAKTAGD